MMGSEESLYQAFVEIALKAKRAGMRRWSARAIIEVLRYETAISDADKVFKINNNQTPKLAQRAMSEQPELVGFFQRRRA